MAGGSGLARMEDGRVVLVAFAAPGELVSALIERVHPDYLEAVVGEVLEASPDRVAPGCELFGRCGGCQLQHISYDAQIRAKESIVLEQLVRIGRFESPPVRPMVGAQDAWGYRNHVRFSTGNKYGDVGFISRRGRGLLKVEQCPIAEPWINEQLPAFQGKAAGLHQVQFRYNRASGSWLVTPRVPGVGLETGQKSYIERLVSRDFQVSASAFFQVNTAQAEQMIRLIREGLPERGALLIDAFAGVGTFAVLLADRFEKVIAIEESNSAGRDSEVNTSDVPNVEFLVGKVEDVLPELDVVPDAVILDPPRAGCAPPVLAALVASRPGRVVYVSCNPATLARDLRVLVDGGLRLESVTPLDMFPQTAHIECVSVLRGD